MHTWAACMGSSAKGRWLLVLQYNCTWLTVTRVGQFGTLHQLGWGPKLHKPRGTPCTGCWLVGLPNNQTHKATFAPGKLGVGEANRGSSRPDGSGTVSQGSTSIIPSSSGFAANRSMTGKQCFFVGLICCCVSS